MVAYDVSSDRHRLKIADLLEMILVRVQYSVFEGEVPEEILESSVRRALQHLDAKTDSLRVYHLCAACAPRIDVYGRGTTTASEAVRIL